MFGLLNQMFTSLFAQPSAADKPNVSKKILGTRLK
jgi:hypothetical protein